MSIQLVFIKYLTHSIWQGKVPDFSPMQLSYTSRSCLSHNL